MRREENIRITSHTLESLTSNSSYIRTKLYIYIEPKSRLTVTASLQSLFKRRDTHTQCLLLLRFLSWLHFENVHKIVLRAAKRVGDVPKCDRFLCLSVCVCECVDVA